VDTYNEAVTVPSFGAKMVCTLLRHHRRRRPAKLARADTDRDPYRTTVELSAGHPSCLDAGCSEQRAAAATLRGPIFLSHFFSSAAPPSCTFCLCGPYGIVLGSFLKGFSTRLEVFAD